MPSSARWSLDAECDLLDPGEVGRVAHVAVQAGVVPVPAAETPRHDARQHEASAVVLCYQGAAGVSLSREQSGSLVLFMHVPQSACSSSFRSVMFVLIVPSQHGTLQNFTCKVSHETVCLPDKPRRSPGRRPSRPRGLRRTASRPQCRGDTWSGTRGWRSSCGHTGRKETPARRPAAGPNSGSRLEGRRGGGSATLVGVRCSA